jgi:hypothetical protein
MNSPTASIAVRGAGFTVAVSPGGDTEVTVYEGAVQATSLSDPSQTVLVEAGRGVLIQAGRDFHMLGAAGNPLAGRPGWDDSQHGDAQENPASGAPTNPHFSHGARCRGARTRECRVETLLDTMVGKDSLPSPGVGMSADAARTSAQCHLVFPIPPTCINSGADSRPQPALWPAWRRWQAPDFSREERDEGVPRGPGGPPSNYAESPALRKLSGIAHECVRHIVTTELL